MKFSTQEDIETPIAEVFDRLCDFAHFEHAAMRRGAEVARIGDWTEPAEGNVWTARFSMRGRRRLIELEIAHIDPPHELRLELRSKTVAGTIGFELIALARRRTRLIVGFEIRPLTLPARLLVQSMKLSKPSLTRKFKQRVAEQIASIRDTSRGEG